jgi:hypothetical protein
MRGLLNGLEVANATVNKERLRLMNSDGSIDVDESITLDKIKINKDKQKLYFHDKQSLEDYKRKHPEEEYEEEGNVLNINLKESKI